MPNCVVCHRTVKTKIGARKPHDGWMCPRCLAMSPARREALSLQVHNRWGRRRTQGSVSSTSTGQSTRDRTMMTVIEVMMRVMSVVGVTTESAVLVRMASQGGHTRGGLSGGFAVRRKRVAFRGWKGCGTSRESTRGNRTRVNIFEGCSRTRIRAGGARLKSIIWEV
jgi:hypothetical protein